MRSSKSFSRLTIGSLLMVSASIGSAQNYMDGSIMHDGLQRDYKIYVPAIYQPGTAVPVVFNFHGYTSDNFQQSLYADFRLIADTANFIIVLPNGTLDPQGNRFWDTFGLGQVDDLGFVAALLDTLSLQYTIDADRVYSTGMSNGGFMSYDLACFQSDRFAAIASVTGTMITPRLAACNATHPTPVMQIHGTADPTVNYGGGGGFVGIEDLVQHWVQFNNCSATPVITDVPNVNTTDGCTAQHYVYSGGDLGSSVEFFKIIGGGHTWPGAPFIVGVTNLDINACKEIWRFFNQYTLSQFVGVAEQVHSTASFTVGPNPSLDSFTLRFEQPTIRTIRIENATGQVVRQVVTSSTMLEFTLEAEGVYLVHVLEGSTSSIQRVVKL
ncbi:MAG: prolyl oligopeptidase family serine peptidase [Flavobacteriales bacterium]|nr:prolyl oligopeptidase family serine peptidase [Flavobacteriales bacterium]